MAYSTFVYYKDRTNTSGTVCSGFNNVLPNATPGPDNSYQIFYNEIAATNASLGDGSSIADIADAGLSIWIDELSANSEDYTAQAPSGWYAIDVFDTTQSSTTDVYQWTIIPGNTAQGTWNNTPISCGIGTPPPAAQSIFAFQVFSTGDVNNGSYCSQNEAVTIYYDGGVELFTIEQIIYNYNQSTIDLAGFYQPQGAPDPSEDSFTLSDLSDPGMFAQYSLQEFKEGSYGSSLGTFYNASGSSITWNHAVNGSETDYTQQQPVPNADPGSTTESAAQEGWDPFQCPNAGAPTIDLYFGATATVFCDSPASSTYYYYIGPVSPTYSTIEQLSQNGILIFTTEADAITNHTNPAHITNIANKGNYSHVTNYSYEYGQLSGWSSASTSCILVGNPEAKEININISACGEYGENVGLCHYPTESIAVYYYAAQTLNLLEVIQNNLYLYNSSSGATNSNYNDLIDYQFFSTNDNSIPADQYFIWTGGTFLGKDTTDGVQQAVNQISPITQGYTCPTTTRSPIYNTELLDTGGSRVFYAFYKCSPVTMSNSNNSYPIYIIDADHYVGGTSYVTDFVSLLKDGSTHVFSTGICDCLEYAHTIHTNTESEAKLLLESYYTAVEYSEPSLIGIYSENTVNLYPSCSDCSNQSNGTQYAFPLIEEAQPIQTGPNTNTEKNYKLDNVSIPLLRTNPKLSTNVKLVADTSNKIYFDSINATQDLSDSNYKKWELSADSRYSDDLARYYLVNSTPIDSAFTTKRDYSDFSVLDSYDKQYEEDYQYGAKLNTSKMYSEDYRITAPIWLDINIPKKFVIYRVDNPKPDSSFENSSDDNLSRIIKMTSNSTIVKVFDLTKQSSIGKYIRRHVQDEFFPESPITITMEKDRNSTFNGIDLQKGGFTRKSEYLYEDYVKKDLTIINANDFITDGFRRNQLACANLINLEFMFDDESTEGYSVNRYFGLYVDDFDSGVGEISYIKGGVVKFKNLESYLEGNDPTFAIPEFTLLRNSGTLAYAKIGDSFYNLDGSNTYDANRYNVSIKANIDEINSKLGITKKDKSVRLVSNPKSGGDFVKMKFTSNPVNNDLFRVTPVKNESVRFKIISNVNGDLVNIADKFGNYVEFTMGVDSSTSWTALEAVWADIEINPGNYSIDEVAFYNRYELSVEADNSQINSIVLKERSSNLLDNELVVTSTASIIAQREIYTNVDQEIGAFMADDTGILDKGQFNSSRFSALGSTSDVAFAFAGAIRNNTGFNAFSVNEYVYIISSVQGYRLMNCSVIIPTNNTSITGDDVDLSNDLGLSQDILDNYTAYYFNGGHSGGKSMYVESTIISEINKGDYIPTNYKDSYNLVLDVVEDTDVQNSLNHKIILQQKNVIPSSSYEIYVKNKMTLGMFSAYDIHDMDFDTYNTSNSELKELEYETRLNMNYQPYEDAILNVGDLGPDNTIGPDFITNPIKYFANLQSVLKVEDSTEVAPVDIDSEYDRLNENSLKEYSTNSRVVPDINKWALKNTTNVREEPYYLNVNEAFGRTNFSPDITVEGRNRESFTHEWFYLDKWPNYMTYDMYNEGFSYINFVDGVNIERGIFADVDVDYFDMFMITEGHEVPITLIDSLDGVTSKNSTFYTKTNLKKKYTLIGGGNSSDFASTIFKGLKFVFKKKKDGQSLNNSEFFKDSEFNGYKFSTLVKVDTNASSNNIEYEFIKNDKFGFIIFFIKLNIQDIFVGDYMNRKYLYELQHKIITGIDPNNGGNYYKYGDVTVDGAINVASTNWASGPYIVNGVNNINGTSPNFDTQISANSDGTYGTIEIDYGFPNLYYLDVVKVVSSDKIQVSGAPYYYAGAAKQAINPYMIPTQSQASATYTYLEGGVNAHATLLRDLSANTVYDKLKDNTGEIKFTTINESGIESSNQYAVFIDDGNEIIKQSSLISEVDKDTPKSFKLKKETIGYELQNGNTYYPFLIRHNGNYTVITRPVVTFTDVYGFNKVIRDQRSYDYDFKSFKEPYYKLNLSTNYEINKSIAYYNRYNRLGTSFNVGFISDNGKHDKNWGIIKNHFYHKVNEINTAGVTKLSESSEHLPQYPLINEIAIDKKDRNVFKSAWEDSYYVRSKAGGQIDYLPGTISTIEEKSYLASALVKYRPSYSIFEFTTLLVSSESELDSILINDSSRTNVVFFEDENNIIADFYLSDLIAEVIGNDGLKETIKSFVSPEKSEGDKTTIVDDIKQYAVNNIVNLYVIDSLQLYTKRYKGQPSEVISTDSIDVIDNGYNIDQNFTYQLHGQKPLNFRLIYNKELGYSYSIRTLIKIQA